jgi:restriction system protein
MQREAERTRAAQIRTQTAALRQAEATQRAYERAKTAAEKDRKRLYAEARQAQIDLRNEELAEQVRELENLLTDSLKRDSYIDFEALKTPPDLPAWNPGPLNTPEAAPQRPAPPPPPSGLHRFSNKAKEEHARGIAAQDASFQQALADHADREQQRKQKLQAAGDDHQARTARIQEESATHHAEIDQLKAQLEAADPEAIRTYFGMVLESSPYPDRLTPQARLAYVPESKQLVVEYDLPPFTAVPEVVGYKYVKSTDKVTPAGRPAAQRKSLYGTVIAQITLRCLRELFTADKWSYIDTAVFNGHVDTINPGTGHPERPCLITVRTNGDTFTALDLTRVDPLACLKTLNASVSKNPAELNPVRPVLEFNMVDPRFIDQTDVLSTIDQRPNLMELTPSEFEQVITNLFEKMGLETRLTQASRDGGVDCVAYDPRPIFGGKVVIQAKRYKNTVGVSAVRDLFGTMQNEGASKGILVTTSGYGKSSYVFAEGKPLELLSGTNLLYLLAEHAGIEARIQPPDDWQDPTADMGE